MSCTFVDCKDNLPNKRKKTEQELKHVRRYHRQQSFDLQYSGCILVFQRVSTMDMRYVCRCNTTFATTDSLRSHIVGVKSRSKTQDPCPHMASFAIVMADMTYAFKKQIDGDMAFIIFPLKSLPGGVKLKMDYEEVNESEPEEETEGNNQATNEVDRTTP
ncbi:hypothetical protein BGZ65_006604 [Modicella reniformis]|uniref:C2H2-type domain-containing protein n=1 Tax=Modicella reniformis TaxID=1440133 RepID=A0A9P6IWG0_9FUNG|nr:hypothetical protein BGZ65_006604 [Modicella reniformis]